jgi:hypothetical protein
MKTLFYFQRILTQGSNWWSKTCAVRVRLVLSFIQFQVYLSLFSNFWMFGLFGCRLFLLTSCATTLYTSWEFLSLFFKRFKKLQISYTLPSRKDDSLTHSSLLLITFYLIVLTYLEVSLELFECLVYAMFSFLPFSFLHHLNVSNFTLEPLGWLWVSPVRLK